MIITYLLFGENKSNYRQAYWSALSFMAELKEEDKIVILTDHPSYVNWISEQADILILDDKILREWRGEFDFFWRIKIKAMQKVTEKYPDQDLLYLDSDTFLKGGLEEIRLSLLNGINLMHTKEGELWKFKAKTTRHMWRRMKGKKYAGVEINQKSIMWNAGVVGLSPPKHSALEHALQICDEMCHDVDRKRLLEQYALSLALNIRNELGAAGLQIQHYWNDKDHWNQLIDGFILDAYLKRLSLEDQIEEVVRIINAEL